MDKAARIILGIAIAIIYPVLVFIAVMQIFPTSEETQKYPEYPRCNNNTSARSYNYDTDRYEYNYDYQESNGSCESEREAYHDKLEEYDKARNEDLVMRAIVGLVIGLFTIVGIYFVRDVRELTGGIVAGSSVVILTATSTLAGVGSDSDLNGLIVFLILLTFGILTFVLKMVDEHVQNEEIQTVQAVPQSDVAQAPAVPSTEEAAPATETLVEEKTEETVKVEDTKPEESKDKKE